MSRLHRPIILVLGLIFVVLSVAFVHFFYSTSSKPAQVELSDGSLILVPRENQLFQRQGESALVDVVVKNNAECTLDDISLKTLVDVKIKTGRHSLECATDTEVDKAEFTVGDLFVVSGQSNAVGASLNPEKEPKPSEMSVFYDPFKRAFVKLGYNLENKLKGIEIGGSAWPSFANTYTEKTQVHVGIIGLTKVAPINTYFAGKEFPKSDYFYSFFIDEIEKLGPVKGIIWYHGESAEATDELALSYKKDLQKFIAYVRQDLGYEVPFYLVNVGRMKNVTPESEERLKIVRQAIEEIAVEEKNVFVIARAEKYTLNCEESETSKDCVHLGQEGQNQLGVDVATALVEQLSK